MTKSTSQKLVKLPLPDNDSAHTAFDGFRVLALLNDEAIRKHLEDVAKDFSGLELKIVAEKDKSLDDILQEFEQPDTVLVDGEDLDDLVETLHALRDRVSGNELYVCSLVAPHSEEEMLRILRDGSDDVAPPMPSVSSAPSNAL